MMKKLMFGKGNTKSIASMAKKDANTLPDKASSISSSKTSSISKATEASMNEDKSHSTLVESRTSNNISKATDATMNDDKSHSTIVESTLPETTSNNSSRTANNISKPTMNDDKSHSTIVESTLPEKTSGFSSSKAASNISKANNATTNDDKSHSAVVESTTANNISKTTDAAMNDDKSHSTIVESKTSNIISKATDASMNDDKLVSTIVERNAKNISKPTKNDDKPLSVNFESTNSTSQTKKSIVNEYRPNVPFLQPVLLKESDSSLQIVSGKAEPSSGTDNSTKPESGITKVPRPQQNDQSTETTPVKPILSFIEGKIEKRETVVYDQGRSRKKIVTIESIGKYYEKSDEEDCTIVEDDDESEPMTKDGLIKRKCLKQLTYKDQYMETDYDEKLDNQLRSRHSIPCYFLTVLFGYLFLLGYLTSLIDDAMPKVLTAEEAGRTEFSEERAWIYLREIVGDGPRVAGTKYHLEKTADLKLMLDDIASAANLPVHVEWQTISGDYWLNYPRPYCSFYENTTNIIALLEGESGFLPDGSTNSTILINCHYDSRPTSPGAADDALFCAAMVEVLQILSTGDFKLKHNIVFLFNGAEEFPLMGVPGFLRHRWARGSTGIINLDSAGINCKSMLFQVSDARVAHAYSRVVPQPSAQSVGEFLFKSGLIPSDTDFRLFRDLSQIYGVDIAFSKQGHVYHTRHDSLEILRPGVLQHSGNMLLALTTELAESQLFQHKSEEESVAVYWDYLNWFMLSYSPTVALWLDLLVVLLAVATVFAHMGYVGFSRSTLLELCWAVAGRVAAAGAGALAVLLLTALAVATTVQMRYLSNGWMVVPLYWMPFLTGAVAASQGYDAWRCSKSGMSRSRRVSQSQAATRLLVACAVLVALVIPRDTSTARYPLSVSLLFMSVTSLVLLACHQRRWLHSWQLLVLDVILATPALMFLFVLALKINTVMLPIMGRSTTGTPDYLVAVLNLGCALLVSLPLSGIELLFSRLRLWTVLLTFSLVCVVITFVPLSPYTENDVFPALQRHNWFHAEIYNYDQSGALVSNHSGVWFGKTEVNTPYNIIELAAQNNFRLRNVIKNFGNCKKFTYCNMPMVTPRTIDYFKGSMWTDFPPPPAAEAPPSLSLQSIVTEQDVRTFNFVVNGPHHLSLIVSPRSGVSLTRWSLHTDIIATEQWEGRPVYFVHIGRITYTEQPADINISFSFRVPDPASSAPIVDVALNAHRTGHSEQFSAEFRALLASMPDYFNIEPYLSSRYNYVF